MDARSLPPSMAANPEPVVVNRSKGCHQVEEGVLFGHAGPWNLPNSSRYWQANQATARVVLEAFLCQGVLPDYLKYLDVVGVSSLTRRVCFYYRGITLLSLPGKVYGRVLERRIQPIASVFRRKNVVFIPAVELCTSSKPSTRCLRDHGSLPNQSTSVLFI